MLVRKLIFFHENVFFLKIVETNLIECKVVLMMQKLHFLLQTKVLKTLRVVSHPTKAATLASRQKNH